jgi:hypothetical protein
MSVSNFVRRAELGSKNTINNGYRSLDLLYFELDFLNDLLLRYSNKNTGITFSKNKRLYEMATIRERIPQIYEEINYYKDIINYEKKEMKRINDTYGKSDYYEISYDKTAEEFLNEAFNHNDYDAFDEFNQYTDSEYSDNEFEEKSIDENNDDSGEYKFNPITGMFE